MDTEIAWESFKKSNSQKIEKTSVAGMLDTISAQLNDIKTDTERTANIVPKIMGDETALESAGSDAADQIGANPTPMPGEGMGMDGDMSMGAGAETEEVEGVPSGGAPGEGADAGIEMNEESTDEQVMPEVGSDETAPSVDNLPEMGAETPIEGEGEEDTSMEGGELSDMTDDELDAILSEGGDEEMNGEEGMPMEGGEAGAEEGAAPEQIYDELLDAIKDAAHKAIDSGDVSIISGVTDAMDAIKGIFEDRLAGAETEETSEPVEETEEMEETEEVPDLSDEDEDDETMSEETEKDTEEVKKSDGEATEPIMESDGMEVNKDLSSPGEGPIEGDGDGDEDDEDSHCEQVREAFGIPEGVDMKALKEALLGGEHGEPDGDEVYPAGMPGTGVVEIEVKEDDEDKDMKKSMVLEEPLPFKDLYKMKKSAKYGVDGKPPIEKAWTDEEGNAPDDELNDRIGHKQAINTFEDKKAGSAHALKDNYSMSESEKINNEIADAQGRNKAPDMSGQKSLDNFSRSVDSQEEDEDKDDDKDKDIVASPQTGGIDKSADVPSKHIASMQELMSMNKSKTSRPDNTNTVNGDLVRPELGRIQKTATSKPEVKMGRGVDPHKVVESDWEEYKLYKAQKGF